MIYEYIKDTQYLLDKYRHLKNSTTNLEEELEEVNSRLNNYGNQSITGMPKGGGKSKDKGLCELLYKKQVLEKSLKETISKVNKIEKCINCLDKDEKSIIELKYFGRLTDQAIADTVHVSLSTVKRKRESALHNIAIQLYGITAL
ncbi:MAG: RNA polymerase sigma factor [Peptostreptococcaceae bacterium]